MYDKSVFKQQVRAPMLQGEHEVRPYARKQMLQGEHGGSPLRAKTAVGANLVFALSHYFPSSSSISLYPSETLKPVAAAENSSYPATPSFSSSSPL